MQNTKKILFLYVQLTISAAAIFGSLFFSEVMKFPPCDLCWYQRILLYPVALIVLTGIYLQSKDTNRFVAPFAWLGLGIAIYHNLVYYKVIQVFVPCTESAPCTAQQLNYLRFITIPLLSVSAFLLLSIINFFAIFFDKKESYEK